MLTKDVHAQPVPREKINLGTLIYELFYMQCNVIKQTKCGANMHSTIQITVTVLLISTGQDVIIHLHGVTGIVLSLNSPYIVHTFPIPPPMELELGRKECGTPQCFFVYSWELKPESI